MQIFDSYVDAGQALAAKDKQAYYTALVEFLAYGKEPALGGAANAVFTAIRPSLELTRTRSAAGRRGGKGKQQANVDESPKQNGENGEAKGKSNSNGKEDPPNGGSKKAPSPAPPTVEEVRAYAEERGYTFDPEAFVAYYAARGWRLGRGQPMRDWRAACVTWQKRERREGHAGKEEEHGWWDAYDVR